MTEIKGIYRDGCIMPDTVPDWPDGMRVFVEPEPPGAAWERTTGEEWPEDREPPDWDWTATMGSYRNGCVCPYGPVDWPDGTQVDLEAKPDATEEMGMSEDDWPTTPEGIAEILAKMDAIEPLTDNGGASGRERAHVQIFEHGHLREQQIALGHVRDPEACRLFRSHAGDVATVEIDQAAERPHETGNRP